MLPSRNRAMPRGSDGVNFMSFRVRRKTRGHVKWVRCRYCGARLRRDAIGQKCPTRNCQWEHGLPKSEDTP